MYVIIGATGRVGGRAAAVLRHAGAAVRAVVRDPATPAAAVLRRLGCEVAVADLRRPDEVHPALDGATGVHVICPLAPGAADPLADARHVADTLARVLAQTRPRAVAAVSDYGAELAAGTGITLALRDLEQRLTAGCPAAGIGLTLLRSAEHMENWARVSRGAAGTGVLPSMHDPVTKRFPAVSAADVGAVAAEFLLAAPPPAGAPRVVHVEGPHRYTAGDVADVVAARVGRPVVAQVSPRERWTSVLTGAGLSARSAQLVAETFDAHNAGRIDIEPGGDVRRGPTPLAEALAAELARAPAQYA